MFQAFRRGNVLHIAGLDGALLPGVENLLDALADQPMAFGDIGTTPTEHEVELHNFPLQIRAIMLGEDGNLRWKADPVIADGGAQPIDPEILDLLGQFWAHEAKLAGAARMSVR